jgi:hypothetical protein
MRSVTSVRVMMVLVLGDAGKKLPTTGMWADTYRPILIASRPGLVQIRSSQCAIHHAIA